MGFSRQEYWSGLSCPPPGDLPKPGIRPASLTSPALQAGPSPLVPPGKPQINYGEKKIQNSGFLRAGEVDQLRRGVKQPSGVMVICYILLEVWLIKVFLKTHFRFVYSSWD